MLKSEPKKIQVPKSITNKARIAVIRSDYNLKITRSLERYCIFTLTESGILKDHIDKFSVPGALEIPVTAKHLAEKGRYDVIIALGVVIKGETYHFELVANECARGCMDVALEHSVPVIFEVLATYNEEQAVTRGGNDERNKGIEAAHAGLKMLKTLSEIKKL